MVVAAAFVLGLGGLHVLHEGLEGVLLALDPPLGVVDLPEPADAHAAHRHQQLDEAGEGEDAAEVGVLALEVVVGPGEEGVVLQEEAEEQVELAGVDHPGVDLELLEEGEEAVEGELGGVCGVGDVVGDLLREVDLGGAGRTL